MMRLGLTTKNSGYTELNQLSADTEDPERK